VNRDYRVVIRKRAEAQIAAAHDWYEREREGLGEEFLVCMRDAIEHLQSFAGIYAMAYRDFRRIPVARFPYGVFYRIVKRRVIVHRVLHNRQSLSNLE
jgi:plasmid stabilization system protein ParE